MRQMTDIGENITLVVIFTECQENNISFILPQGSDYVNKNAKPCENGDLANHCDVDHFYSKFHFHWPRVCCVEHRRI